MDSNEPSYITNPQTQKPVRIGSRVYNRLIRQGVINPEDYAEKLPMPRERGRPKKTKVESSYKLVRDDPVEEKDEELKQIIKEEEDAQRKHDISYREAESRHRDSNKEPRRRVGREKPHKPVEDLEYIDRGLMQRVASCTANSIKKDPQKFEGMSEDEVLRILQKMIVDELGDEEAYSDDDDEIKSD